MDRPSFSGRTQRGGGMLQSLKNWWRGYSEEDMESVKERLSYSQSGGIYVSPRERLALKDLNILRKAEKSRKPEDL